MSPGSVEGVVVAPAEILLECFGDHKTARASLTSGFGIELGP